jgi:hypothetical protein
MLTYKVDEEVSVVIIELKVFDFAMTMVYLQLLL